MDEASAPPELLDLTTEIVAAYAGSHTLPASALPGLIGSVFLWVYTLSCHSCRPVVGGRPVAAGFGGRLHSQRARWPSRHRRRPRLWCRRCRSGSR